MATRFIDKAYGADSSTAIADDATGTRKVQDLQDAAGFVIDSVDGFIKYNDAGNIRTLLNAEEAQTISGAKTFTGNVVLSDITFEIGDDDLLTLGNDNDSVVVHKSAINNANTALTGVLIGTPVTQATAANSTIISNVTASGDILVAANRGGASEEYLFADSSAGTLTLTGPGGIINFESGTTQVLGINSATVIEIPDSVQLTLGTDNDSVLMHKETSTTANTAVGGALIGTPVVQALAANSTIVSNVTASGDVLIAANRAGASEEYLMADSSAGTLTLTGPGGVINFESGTTQVLGINSATVIEVGDDINFNLGADNDAVLRHKTTSTTANTAVTGAIVGTPVVPALAANSVVLSNITADGDIALITQTGGNSQAALFVDASANTTELYAAGVSKVKISSIGLEAVVGSEIVTTTNVITAAEAGRTYYLDLATGFASTLPAPALGLEFKFIVKTAPTGGAGYTIGTDAAAQVFVGGVHDAGGAAGDVESTLGANVITFVNDAAVVGDTAIVHSDGTNWYCRVFTNVATGATFTG